jgi:hypothetical protein
MKICNATFLLSVMLLMIVVSGCGQSNQDLATPTSSVTSISATSTEVLTPSVTPLPIETPTPIFTPTIALTLPVKDAQATLLELLANNANCRLPCLWGITPGKTTYQEAQNILLSMSSISELTSFMPEGGAIFPIYEDVDFELYTAIGFMVDPSSLDQEVNRIGFTTEAHKPLEEGGYEDILDSKSFGEKVSAYTLPHVLSQLGAPESVSISTFGAPLTRGGTGGFDLLLLYPNQGILINYTTQMHLNGKGVRGCLTNAHVEMELYTPGQPDLFRDWLKKTDWAVKMNYYKPLEEVTSMSVQDFYKTFRVPTDTCIETPAEIWPIPEP